jgi:hypothetical protein
VVVGIIVISLIPMGIELLLAARRNKAAIDRHA